MIADALPRLYARIPLGMRLGLEPMREACARFDHPERAFEAVHVAGTNGKGSVCAMVESIARADGRKTGLFTSPHLCRFAERIRLQGEPLDDAALSDSLELALDGAPDLSFFETATLAAFLAFREAKVDLAVVEVGIGGRLDATNVLPRPRAAAITRIALDHTDRLGPTLVDIAREKAGIAKPGLDLVLGPMPAGVRAAIDAVARELGATTTALGAGGGDPPVPARIGLEGAYQRDNARIAAALGARIGAAPAAIADGIARVRWPGRLERIEVPRAGGEPLLFLLDAAHNPDGAGALARHVSSLGVPPARVSLVFGALGDKDWPAMLDALAPLARARIYVAPQGNSRSGADPARPHRPSPGRRSEPVAAALARVGALSGARAAGASAAGAGDAPSPSLIVVAGSLVLVGEARAALLGLPRDPPVAL